MYFHEDSIHSTGDPCPSHVFNELRVAAARRSQTPRPLKAVSHIVDDRVTEASHDWEAAKVDNEIVVAKARSSFRDEDAMILLR